MRQFFLVNQTLSAQQFSRIPEQMTLMSQFYLMYQTHNTTTVY